MYLLVIGLNWLIKTLELLLIGGWGAAQPGNRFVSFVRAYARSGCLVELDQNFCGLCFSLFPFVPARSWGFSFCVSGGFGELSLFPFGAASLPFSLLVPGSFPFSLEAKIHKVYKV